MAGLDFAEICITSDIEITDQALDSNAFTLPEVDGVQVQHRLAKGEKCARSWQMTDSVGSDPAFPDVSARDAKALHELKALGKI